jgi:hypothetical protein
VGIAVNDFAETKAFFLAFGLLLQGEGRVEGSWEGNVIGLHDVKNAYAMLCTPDEQDRERPWQILRVSAIVSGNIKQGGKPSCEPPSRLVFGRGERI